MGACIVTGLTDDHKAFSESYGPTPFPFFYRLRPYFVVASCAFEVSPHLHWASMFLTASIAGFSVMSNSCDKQRRTWFNQCITRIMMYSIQTLFDGAITWDFNSVSIVRSIHLRQIWSKVDGFLISFSFTGFPVVETNNA